MAYPHIKYQIGKSQFYLKSILFSQIRQPRWLGTYIAIKCRHERECENEAGSYGPKSFFESAGKRDAETD